MKRLVADIGNTHIKLARMDGLVVEDVRRLAHEEIEDEQVLETAVRALRQSAGMEAVVCSVVPAIYGIFASYCAKTGIEVIPVVASQLSFLSLKYSTLGTLGVDRYCGVVAAAGQYGSPCVTIDMGTATTVNVVDPEGAYIGGAIAVGLRTAYAALHTQTAQLPLLQPRMPESLVGATTEESIHAGVTAMHVFGLQSMIARIANDFKAKPVVCFTGGNMDIIPRNEFPGAVFDRNLLLKGIAMYANEKKTQNSSNR